MFEYNESANHFFSRIEGFSPKIETDEALADILIGERITTIRKFTNMTTSFLDAVKEKATYTAIDNDINVIERFLPAHAHHLQSTKRFPNYESMDIATIDTIIATYEEKEFAPTPTPPLSPTAASTMETTHSTSKNNYSKRTLTSFENCKFPKVPVGAQAMKEFIISFTNICRSMKLEYMLEPDFICPIDTDSSFSTFEDDNKFIFSALIQVTTKHEAQTIINTAAFKNDGLSSWHLS